jgi:hypothetical protein
MTPASQACTGSPGLIRPADLITWLPLLTLESLILRDSSLRRQLAWLKAGL